MANKPPISVRRGLIRLGADLKAARLRRGLKMEIVAERAGISRETLAKIQRGDPGVAVGNYASVIFALGLGTAWMGLASIEEDTVGQSLDEQRIPKRARSKKLG